MQYSSDDFVRLGQWKCPVLEECLWVKPATGRFMERLNVDIHEQHVYIDGHVFKSRKSMEAWERLITSKLESGDEAFFDQFFRYAEAETERFLGLEGGIRESESEDNAFERFFSQYLQITPPWNTAIIIGDILGEYIEKEYDAELLQFCSPDRPTYRSRMREEQVKLREDLEETGLLDEFVDNGLEALNDRPEIAAAIQEHVERYAWIETQHFWGTGYDLERFREDVVAAALPEETSPPQYGQDEVRLAKRFAWYRNYTAEVANKLSYAAKPLFKRIGQLLGYAYEDLIWLTNQEILQGLRGGGIPEESTVLERKQGYAAYNSDGLVLQTGDSVQRLKNDWLPSTDEETVRGNTAYKGKVTGEVTVVREPKDISKMNEDDILVASETTPDFLPTMRQAAAIVTDRGGITSHAAITAREMETPCVIGTDNATDVLEDGDMVEVDADEGVVEVLDNG